MPFDATLAAIRFGYGLPAPQGSAQSVKAMLEALGQPDRMATDWPGPGVETSSRIVADLTRTQKDRKQSEEKRLAYKAAGVAMTELVRGAARTHLLRALAGPDGLRERLAAFWADHFTTAPREAPNRYLPFALMDEAIRPNLAGGFADLLTAVTLHPAMLIYLDQSQSVGPNSPMGLRNKRGLNENLARELIELHSLGVGAAYSQDDVRQMAELLTGLAVNDARQMAFQPRRVEPGDETVLGKTYAGDGLQPIRAALRDLALRPETARHIARKLATHFVADNPDEALVDAMQSVYGNSGGDLMAVYAAMLDHPAAWEPAAQKARQPYDFVLAALRALQVTPAELARMNDGAFSRMILNAMATMGQRYKSAPGPDGWAEEAEAWITPQGLAARITWAMEVPARLKSPLPDPTDLAQAALGPRASERLIWAVSRAENIREGVGLVLVSPEFNRR